MMRKLKNSMKPLPKHQTAKPQIDGLGVVVMAAGQGKRMRSKRAKVLHRVAGHPMVLYAVDLALQTAGHRIAVVVGHQADDVRKATQAGILPVHESSTEYFASLRKSEEQILLVVLNFSSQFLHLNILDIAEIKGQNLRILFSSAERLLTTKPPRRLAVSPYEVLIAEIQPAK